MTTALTPRKPGRRRLVLRWLVLRWLLRLIAMLLWFVASLHEWLEYERKLPGDPYAGYGTTRVDTLPERVGVGFYEEFPNPWRLEKLRQLDFPVLLAVAAPSRAEFLDLRDSLLQT